MELNVVDLFSRKGFRFKGTAEIVRDGELVIRILDFYQSRRGDTSNAKLGPRASAFVLLKVERALPLVSPDGSDEKPVRARWISYFSSLHRQTDNAGREALPRPDPTGA